MAAQKKKINPHPVDSRTRECAQEILDRVSTLLADLDRLRAAL